MLIENAEGLSAKIARLKKIQIEKEGEFHEKWGDITKHLDPVYQLNTRLPKRKEAPQFFNELLDESILGVTNTVNGKLAVAPGSFIKNAGSTFLQLSFSKLVNKNNTSIKAYTLAILKNIFN